MVTRYETCCCSQEYETGDYVHYDDYAALRAENELLKAEVESLRCDVEREKARGKRWRFRDRLAESNGEVE